MCNRSKTLFLLIPLFKVAKIAIIYLSLGLSPLNQKKNFKGVKIHWDN